MQLCGRQAPLHPKWPPARPLQLSGLQGFPQASSALGQAFRACLLVYCLSPPWLAGLPGLHLADMRKRSLAQGGCPANICRRSDPSQGDNTRSPEGTTTSCCWFLLGGSRADQQWETGEAGLGQGQ